MGLAARCRHEALGEPLADADDHERARNDLDSVPYRNCQSELAVYVLGILSTSILLLAASQ